MTYHLPVADSLETMSIFHRPCQTNQVSAAAPVLTREPSGAGIFPLWEHDHQTISCAAASCLFNLTNSSLALSERRPPTNPKSPCRSPTLATLASVSSSTSQTHLQASQACQDTKRHFQLYHAAFAARNSFTEGASPMVCRPRCLLNSRLMQRMNQKSALCSPQRTAFQTVEKLRLDILHRGQTKSCLSALWMRHVRGGPILHPSKPCTLTRGDENGCPSKNRHTEHDPSPPPNKSPIIDQQTLYAIPLGGQWKERELKSIVQCSKALQHVHQSGQ